MPSLFPEMAEDLRRQTAIADALLQQRLYRDSLNRPPCRQRALFSGMSGRSPVVKAIPLLNHGGTPLAVDSTVGRAMIGFLAVSARLENDLRADRIRETIAYRKAKGLPYYKHPPFGKRTEVYTDESGRKQKRWVRDDEQCRLLLEIYRLRYTQGWSLAQIAELLDRRGAKDQKGSPWSWRRPCNGTWQVNKLRKAVEYVRSMLQAGKEL